MAACGGGERAGRLVDEEDEAVVGGEGGGVVFLSDSKVRYRRKLL